MRILLRFLPGLLLAGCGGSDAIKEEAAPAVVEADPVPASVPIEKADQPVVSESDQPATPPRVAGRPALDRLLAEYTIPPAWVATTPVNYDTSKPWKEARKEIRRLLGVNTPQTHREAIKLTWIYLQKGDINDGHEYPMYTFMGMEPIWSIKAHQWYLQKPQKNSPFLALNTLARLYADYQDYERAEQLLKQALANPPAPPMRLMRTADVHNALGDLYAETGRTDLAKTHYANAIRIYPAAKPRYGRHLLPRRAKKVQAKLDLLNFRSLAGARLRDGQYRERALGYSGDVNLTVVVKGGRIADVSVQHQEKIDQGACEIVPRAIVAAQSLKVDAVSGATVTQQAIVTGTYTALKKAGL